MRVTRRSSRLLELPLVKLTPGWGLGSRGPCAGTDNSVLAVTPALGGSVLGGWGLPSVDLDSLAVLVRGGAGALCCALEDWGGGRTSRSSEFCQGASVRAQWGKLRQSKSVPGRYELCSVPW